MNSEELKKKIDRGWRPDCMVPEKVRENRKAFWKMLGGKIDDLTCAERIKKAAEEIGRRRAERNNFKIIEWLWYLFVFVLVILGILYIYGVIK